MAAGLVMRARGALAAADGAGTGEIVCGWPTGRMSADSSSKRMPSQPHPPMPPRRHKTGWPYVDPNPLGTLRQSRMALHRLLPRLTRRPGGPARNISRSTSPTGIIATGVMQPPG
jgi:hypothetical protein